MGGKLKSSIYLCKRIETTFGGYFVLTCYYVP